MKFNKFYFKAFTVCLMKNKRFINYRLNRYFVLFFRFQKEVTSSEVLKNRVQLWSIVSKNHGMTICLQQLESFSMDISLYICTPWLSRGKIKRY